MSQSESSSNLFIPNYVTLQQQQPQKQKPRVLVKSLLFNLFAVAWITGIVFVILLQTCRQNRIVLDVISSSSRRRISTCRPMGVSTTAVIVGVTATGHRNATLNETDKDDRACVKEYLTKYLEYCERSLRPRPSNYDRHVIGSGSNLCLCPCIPEGLGMLYCSWNHFGITGSDFSL